MMDRAERARLRALCEAATPGPWETYRPAAGGLGIAHGDPRTQHGCIARTVAGSPADAALMGIARTALPALLDDADAADARIAKAERERDEARAEVERLRAAITRLRDNAAEMQSCARAVGHVEEREACAELAEKWLREVDEITQDTPADLADAIRARGTGGAT